MNPFTPSIGSRGLFRVGAPFDNLLVADLEYVCTAMRSVQDVTGDGLDVFALYYEPQGLTQEVFLADVNAGVYLVTLQPGTGSAVVVPSSYFVGVPDVTGVPYLGLLVALDLAILPADIDLSYLKTQLSSVVKDTIGVMCTARTVVTTNPLRLRTDAHTIIEATRNVNRVENPSDFARYLEEKNRADQLQVRVGKLEEYIRNNHA